jgi:hypothetical protein
MIPEGRFPIPERVKVGGCEAVDRYLDRLSDALTERLSRQLGPEFEFRSQRTEQEPNGVCWCHIGVYRGSRIEAVLSIDWNGSVSGGHFDLQWQEIRPLDFGSAVAAACSAGSGLTLGLAVSGPLGLAFMLLAAPLGALVWLAWRRPAELGAPDWAPARDDPEYGAGLLQVGI